MRQYAVSRGRIQGSTSLKAAVDAAGTGHYPLLFIVAWNCQTGNSRRRFAALPVRSRHTAVLLEATVLTSPSHTSSLGALHRCSPSRYRAELEQAGTSDRFSIHPEEMDVDVESIKR
jgi:hypothetical protein